MVLRDEHLNQIIESIKRAPDREKLSDYLISLANKLNPTKFEYKEVSLQSAMINSLLKEKSTLNISLKNPIFQSLSDFFSLTPGLHIIAAPSGHGKTLWAMEWAKEAAKQDFKILFLSLEMTPEDLGFREISLQTDFILKDLIRDGLSEVQKKLIIGLIDEEKNNFLNNIIIDNPGDYDWIKIFPRLWDRMIRIRPKLVIVDYAQMIFSSDENDSRQSKVLGDIARQLKLFADQTGSAVLLLSQMNREALKDLRRSKWEDLGHVPLSHEYIKESGGIVEAADSVQLVCIPDRFIHCPHEFKDCFQVIVDKSRRLGELGVCKIPFDTEKMKF